MGPRYVDVPVSSTGALAALLGVRGLPQRLIATGALALSLCLLVLLLGAARPAQALVEGEDFKPGQVVVKLDPTIGATIGKINTDYGLTTLDDTLGSRGIYLLKVSAGSNTENVVERLKNDSRL